MQKQIKACVPVIYQWAEGQCFKEVINPDDFWMFCDWCRRYGNNPDDGDTRDLLYRWNIGVYQLHYIGKMMRMNTIAEEEWAESLASVMIHMVTSWEMCGINVAGICIEHTEKVGDHYIAIANSKEDRLFSYHNILESIPTITRQLLYKAQKRQRRFDEKELISAIPFTVFYIKRLYGLRCDKYTFGEGLAIAMDKLQAKEFKTH